MSGEPDGVAIKSTVLKLIQNIHVWPTWSAIGKVKYINFENAKDAEGIDGAFVKEEIKYKHENELRILTDNLKHPNHVKENGQQYTIQECDGVSMYNNNKPGLRVRVNFENLVDEIIMAQNHPKNGKTLLKKTLLRRIQKLKSLGPSSNKGIIHNYEKIPPPTHQYHSFR